MRLKLVCAALSAVVVGFISTAAYAGSITYTYDALGRLITATYDTGVTITYQYDAAGNRTQVVSTGNSTQRWGNFNWGQANW